jgi:hypothetical protein
VYFRFLRGIITAHNNTVSVVASNGYAGKHVEYGTRELNIMAVENTAAMESHRAHLNHEMEKRGHSIWCKDLSKFP